MNERFNSIYDDTYDHVLRFVISKCDNLANVEDIVQNVYLQIFRYIGRYGEQSITNPKKFALKLAKRELFKYYTFKSKIKSVFANSQTELFDNTLEDTVEEISFEDTILDKISAEEIWQQIQTEELITQKILSLHYLQSVTLREIASILDISESTVKSKLYRALTRLKEKFGGKNE